VGALRRAPSWVLERRTTVSRWSIEGFQGQFVATPGMPPAGVELKSFTDFSSGYFQRAMHLLPRQGAEGPWKLFDRYADDRKRLLHEPVDDGVLVFCASPGRVENVELADAA